MYLCSLVCLVTQLCPSGSVCMSIYPSMYLSIWQCYYNRKQRADRVLQNQSSLSRCLLVSSVHEASVFTCAVRCCVPRGEHRNCKWNRTIHRHRPNEWNVSVLSEKCLRSLSLNRCLINIKWYLCVYLKRDWILISLRMNCFCLNCGFF